MAMDHMGQFNADMGLDWMGIRVQANNNCPSKPFSHPYLIHFLTVLNETYMSIVCRLKINHKRDIHCVRIL